MVTTRRGDYITPEKNPPGPLECSPALRRPGDKEEEGEAVSAAVDYAASLTFDDDQLYYENDVAAGGCHRPWYWREIYPDYGASH